MNDTGLEVNTEKTRYVLMYHEQNVATGNNKDS